MESHRKMFHDKESKNYKRESSANCPGKFTVRGLKNHRCSVNTDGIEKALFDEQVEQLLSYSRSPRKLSESVKNTVFQLLIIIEKGIGFGCGLEGKTITYVLLSC